MKGWETSSKGFSLIVYSPFSKNKKKLFTISNLITKKVSHIDLNELSDEDISKYGTVGTIIKRKLYLNKPYIKIQYNVFWVFYQKLYYYFWKLKILIIDLHKK
jgi:hypothetical protein